MHDRFHVHSRRDFFAMAFKGALAGASLIDTILNSLGNQLQGKVIDG